MQRGDKSQKLKNTYTTDIGESQTSLRIDLKKPAAISGAGTCPNRMDK
jgi:hypothetical protein